MSTDTIPRTAAATDTIPRTAAATAAIQQHAAERAIDDPVRLAKAARIVRVALARKRLQPADLGIGDAA